MPWDFSLARNYVTRQSKSDSSEGLCALQLCAAGNDFAYLRFTVLSRKTECVSVQHNRTAFWNCLIGSAYRPHIFIFVGVSHDTPCQFSEWPRGHMAEASQWTPGCSVPCCRTSEAPDSASEDLKQALRYFCRFSFWHFSGEIPPAAYGRVFSGPAARNCEAGEGSARIGGRVFRRARKFYQPTESHYLPWICWTQLSIQQKCTQQTTYLSDMRNQIKVIIKGRAAQNFPQIKKQSLPENDLLAAETIRRWW